MVTRLDLGHTPAGPTVLAVHKVESGHTVLGEGGVEGAAHGAGHVLDDVLRQQLLDVLGDELPLYYQALLSID